MNQARSEEEEKRVKETVEANRLMERKEAQQNKNLYGELKKSPTCTAQINNVGGETPTSPSHRMRHPAPKKGLTWLNIMLLATLYY